MSCMPAAAAAAGARGDLRPVKDAAVDAVAGGIRAPATNAGAAGASLHDCTLTARDSLARQHDASAYMSSVSQGPRQ